MTFKVAFIGAGSIGFTRGLFTDLMSVSEFRDMDVAFTDISERNLKMVTELCQRDLNENGVNKKIQSTTDRKEALAGAKYVITCIRAGMLEAFQTDVEIPLRYGVEQCVGDTLCAGGIMYGQRGIAAMKDICRDIREVAASGVLHLNYANPNAMMTWACNHHFGVDTIGLCHGVMGGQRQIAEAMGLKYEDLDVICAGINHQTWYLSIKHEGKEIKDKLLDAFMSNERFSREEKVRIDILKRFGYYSTESNGHLSEYLAWYRKHPEEIKDWIDLGSWINGETGGALRICMESRNWFETDFPNWLKAPPKKYDGSDRGFEHGSFIIEGLETGRRYRGDFNVVNNGCISNLPDDCIVEVPAYVDYNGVSVPRVGELPLGCAAVCSQSVWVQRLAVEAAVRGDDTLLRQAMLMDPLTGAVLTPPEVWQMVDEMLVAQEKWLPQYPNAIAAAKTRLASGNLIPPRGKGSSVMLAIRSVEEMAEDKERMRRIAGAAMKERIE